ncbi:MAG: glycosyltransferase [Planctomycetes bacterium]|nr:glycosyltransferase [Planctomycetota bacterium]
MKILQVLNAFPSVQPGAPAWAAPGIVELHALHLAHAFAKRKHASTALVARNDPARPEGALSEVQHEGVRVLERVTHQDYPDARASWIDPRADHDFAGVLEREDPDVVHFHHLAGWGPRCIAIAREHGACVVATLHDVHALCDRGTLLRADGEACAKLGADCAECLGHLPLVPPADGGERVERLRAKQAERREHFRRALAQVNVVVVPSRFLARTFAQAGFLDGVLVEILSAGTHGVLHKPRVRKGGRLRLGVLGDLGPASGASVLAGALRLLARAPVELHVHGAAAPPPALADAFAGLPVVFHGRFDPRATDAACAGFDVLVVPSTGFENRLGAIQDAFRCGLPVVASDHAGHSELVQDGIHGLLFPRGDAAGLARSIQGLLGDPGLYNRLARDRPPLASVDAIAARIEGAYTRFARAARPAHSTPTTPTTQRGAAPHDTLP